MTPSPRPVVGFYGKLPARGDFVRGALPRAFTDPWDSWLQAVLAGSRRAMGDAWLPAFLEAPAWRFALPPGLCGPLAALGLMLPSVDRAGRYFPLTFAALGNFGPGVADDSAVLAWLDLCHAAGLAALEQGATPEQLTAMLGEPILPAGFGLSHSVWWTDGSPRVPATRFLCEGLPDATIYATMLNAARGTEQADATELGTVAWDQPS